MNDSALDSDIAIGRRSVPRTAAETPPSGISWSGPVKFAIIQQETSKVFRWVKVSDDGQDLCLAQSASTFTSLEACQHQIERLNSKPKIEHWYEYYYSAAPKKQLPAQTLA